MSAAAAGFLVPITTADAQLHSDTVEVVLTALTHASESLPRGRVMLDPRLVCTASLAGWSCPDRVAERASELGMVLGSRDFTYVCMTSTSGCRLVGTDVLVEVADLRVFGRTATVMLYAWWDTGDPDRPVGRRRSHLHLQRNDDRSWRVIEEEILVPEVDGRKSSPR